MFFTKLCEKTRVFLLKDYFTSTIITFHTKKWHFSIVSSMNDDIVQFAMSYVINDNSFETWQDTLQRKQEYFCCSYCCIMDYIPEGTSLKLVQFCL